MFLSLFPPLFLYEICHHNNSTLIVATLYYSPSTCSMNKLCLLVSKIFEAEILITWTFDKKHFLNTAAWPHTPSLSCVYYTYVDIMPFPYFLCVHSSLWKVWFVYRVHCRRCGWCTEFVAVGSPRHSVALEFELFLGQLCLFQSSSRQSHCVLSLLLEMLHIVLFSLTASCASHQIWDWKWK